MKKRNSVVFIAVLVSALSSDATDDAAKMGAEKMNPGSVRTRSARISASATSPTGGDMILGKKICML